MTLPVPRPHFVQTARYCRGVDGTHREGSSKSWRNERHPGRIKETTPTTEQKVKTNEKTKKRLDPERKRRRRAEGETKTKIYACSPARKGMRNEDSGANEQKDTPGKRRKGKNTPASSGSECGYPCPTLSCSCRPPASPPRPRRRHRPRRRQRCSRRRCCRLGRKSRETPGGAPSSPRLDINSRWILSSGRRRKRRR